MTSGYWFVPAVMMACATVLAFVLLYLDRNVIETHRPQGWLYAGGPGGAKTLL
jgi:uncharacterized membrane protein